MVSRPRNYLEAVQSGVSQPSYYFPKNEEGRQLVIADIHGCAKSFKLLVEKLELTRKDQLFLLGDYINRGPDNMGVLDFILELMERGYKVWPLRGNHEEMLISAHRTVFREHLKLPSLHTQKGIVDKNRKILPRFRAFFENLPYYFELPKYFLVHAGFDYRSQNPYTNYKHMPWIRPFDASAIQARYKQIVVGHNPTTLGVIRSRLKNVATVILLDNGCAFSSKEQQGNLVALDLGCKKLYIQPNIENKSRKFFFIEKGIQ